MNNNQYLRLKKAPHSHLKIFYIETMNKSRFGSDEGLLFKREQPKTL